MNLSIKNNRRGFYQWDTGQQLIIEGADGSNEVHFCHRGDASSLTCRIREEDGFRVADVPNILLQTDTAITAYLYCYAEDGAETRFAKSFQVLRRPKPESYVYTETETLNYSSLVARLDQIEKNGVSDEQIARALEDYLTENPAGVDFEVGETLRLENGILSVNTTDLMEQDNTLPITSAGVHATVGNIEVLLKTI